MGIVSRKLLILKPKKQKMNGGQRSLELRQSSHITLAGCMWLFCTLSPTFSPYSTGFYSITVYEGVLSHMQQDRVTRCTLFAGEAYRFS